MSDNDNILAVPIETETTPPKKKRGFAAHKPDCQCKFHRRQRDEKIESSTEKPKAEVTDMKDSMDTKLDHFRYSLDPGVAKRWQSDDSLSPLHLEEEFTSRYSNLAFKYLSTNKIDRVGKNYHGWEIFHDGEYPEGRKLGNDLILAAKPKEDNEDYKRRCIERSEVNLRRGVESYKQGLMPGQEGLEVRSGVGPLVNQVIRQDGRVAGTGIDIGVLKVRQQPQPSGPQPAKKSYFLMGGK